MYCQGLQAVMEKRAMAVRIMAGRIRRRIGNFVTN